MAWNAHPHLLPALRCLSGLAELGQAPWQAMQSAHCVSAQETEAYPFISYAFLQALEESGAVAAATGWQPAHLYWQQAQQAAALPCYLKQHSRGEYVFDQPWAEAWQRAGQSYYPKGVVSIPFSPVQGPRLLGDRQGFSLLEQQLRHWVEERQLSSVHVLFSAASEQDVWQAAGWLQRLGCQFHWYNRGYQEFADFLALLQARKRKNMRKEREQISQQGVSVRWRAAVTLDEQEWRQFYQCYASTYWRRGQQPYLPLRFFQLLAARLPEQVQLVQALHQGRWVASALFLQDQDCLYGRYWGCLEHYDKLHFECCFYQGMERAIAAGLKRFDAGAQGEHKLLRGFEPVLTHSWHWLQPGLQQAVADFLQQERPAVRAYAREASSYLPYNQAWIERFAPEGAEV